MILENDIYTFSFNEKTGSLVSAQWGNKKLEFDGIRFDIGCNEKNLTGFLKYDSLLEKHTWERPEIIPENNNFPDFPVKIIQNQVIYTLEKLDLIFEYKLDAVLSLDVKICNTSNNTLYINTLTLAPALCGIEGVSFNYPANVPGGDYNVQESPISAGLVNFAIHTKTPNGDANILFIDKIEKWGTAVWHDNNNVYYAYCVAVEADLLPNKTIEVGTLYIQPCNKSDPYLQIRTLIENLGYKPVVDGLHSGVLYSCHPYGTMDSIQPEGTLDGNFSSLKMDMKQFAKFLPDIKKMGVDHVWVLPIFEHPIGTNPYHSTDQAIIDKRYGTDEDVKNYCDKAHKLGLTVLFDYVPHGPAPELPLARDNPDWCAKRRDGSLQDEWHCVSMDYNHPDYLQYTTDLIYDHVKRFGIDGARIDCAMGGLSNWRPYGDNRASASSVQAGVNISDAIRKGFIKGGKKPFNMPENFNPIPQYYFCTDVFYGMNFYRMLEERETDFHNNPAAFVKDLCTWLDRENKTMPLVKLRFLGNHDTVSWVWQKRRATEIYGHEGVKAMWAFISLIDGVPMIYQGDEDPALYGGTGPKYHKFFKQLFTDRKKWTHGNKTEYVFTDTPIAAFFRHENLVLVNLDKKSQVFDSSDYNIDEFDLCAGDAKVDYDKIIVPPYKYAIFSLT